MTGRMHSIVLALSLSISTLGCGAGETPAPASESLSSPTAEENRAAIDALMDRLEAAYAATDIDLLMDVYTDDLVYMGADTPAIKGAADFRAENDPVGAYDLVMDNEEVVVTGDWGYARGSYDGNDQYLMIVRRDNDGVWRLAREIWNIAPDEE